MRPSWLFPVLLFVAFGCGGEDDSGSTEPPPSGSGGAPPHEPADFCPDPEHPRVHYIDADANACLGIELDCDDEQNGFQNACGCGCIDKGDPLCPVVTDPSITWHSRDPSECPEEPAECPLGEVGFSNTCGCGCLKR